MSDEQQQTDGMPPAETAPDVLGKLIDWLAEKGINPLPCPVCRHHDWTVSNKLFVAEGITPEGERTDEVLPLVVMECEYCSYNVYFNAVRLGVWRGPMPEEGEGDDAEGETNARGESSRPRRESEDSGGQPE